MHDGNSLEAVNLKELLDIDEILEKKKFQLVLKRMFDFIVSLIGLICLLPVFFVIAILIKIDSKGPVFFKQVRVGKDIKEFKIFKFRTMIQDSEKKGMQITVGRDSRITKFGYVLRRTKIDELPQLINILIGDMSFVGPRPEVPKYIEMYTEQQQNILKIKPGITDLASIEYRDENTLLSDSNNPEETYIKEIMPRKIQLNVEYLRRFSIFYDIKIIIKTILAVMK